MGKVVPYPKIKVKFEWLGDKCGIRVMINDHVAKCEVETHEAVMFEASCAYVVASMIDEIAGRMYEEAKEKC
ncbi:MAG: hypothetical protein DRJ03_22875 [Chloroflexi bacterium]|nr:MAG: hypothetical protein DRJ03_22875 [Chloroflexota bacterium]